MTGTLTLRDLGLAQLRKAVEIKTEIETLMGELDTLASDTPVPMNGLRAMTDRSYSRKGKGLHWTQTAAGKRRMARLQRKSWKKRHTQAVA